nr:MAG TPA_asm: hypothetical protein [Bacteriophage sp.]
MRYALRGRGYWGSFQTISNDRRPSFQNVNF